MNKTFQKIIVVATILSVGLFFSKMTFAQQNTDSENATTTGTPDNYVEVTATDNSISFGTLNISQQSLNNQRIDSGTKYVIFESKNDITSDSIAYNEGATNANAFYKVTYTGQTYPAVGGLDNTGWIFFRDSSSNSYVQSKVTGTLTNGGGGVTMPVGVTEIGSFSTNLIYYSSADAEVTWTRASKTIYVALGNNGRLYVNDNADLTTAQYVALKGDTVNTAFFSNNMALTTTFPTQVNDQVSFDFGAYIAWDSTQGNSTKTLYNLIDLPQHAATAHQWTWDLTITGEYHSNP